MGAYCQTRKTTKNTSLGPNWKKKSSHMPTIAGTPHYSNNCYISLFSVEILYTAAFFWQCWKFSLCTWWLKFCHKIKGCIFNFSIKPGSKVLHGGGGDKNVSGSKNKLSIFSKKQSQISQFQHLISINFPISTPTFLERPLYFGGS